MSENLQPLDDVSRRYYLNAIGIQCWDLLTSTGAENQPVNLDALSSTINHCQLCSLHKNRIQALPGRGDTSADLLFVLLSPDHVDDHNGKLCSGEADELFRKMLAAIDLSIDSVYITSILKCMVPEEHTITVPEITNCLHYLKQQIHHIKPRLMVILGDTAARCLLQLDKPLDTLREQINVSVNSALTHYESTPILISYSPHELLENPGNKRKAWTDLQQIQQVINS